MSVLTLAEAAGLISAKKLSPVELTQACLSRMHRLDGALHAFIHTGAKASRQTSL